MRLWAASPWRAVSSRETTLVEKLNEIIGEGFEVVGLDYTTDDGQRVHVVLQRLKEIERTGPTS